VSRTVRGLVLFAGIVFLLAVGGVLSYFLIINSQWVVLRFPGLSLRWDAPFPTLEVETPLAVVMAVCFVLGFFAAALLIVVPTWLRRGVERRRERRFIRGLEGELTDLRNLPLTTPAPLEDLPEEGSRQREREDTQEDEERALLAAALQEPARPAKLAKRPERPERGG